MDQCAPTLYYYLLDTIHVWSKAVANWLSVISISKGANDSNQIKHEPLPKKNKLDSYCFSFPALPWYWNQGNSCSITILQLWFRLKNWRFWSSIFRVLIKRRFYANVSRCTLKGRRFNKVFVITVTRPKVFWLSQLFWCGGGFLWLPHYKAFLWVSRPLELCWRLPIIWCLSLDY